MYILEDISWNLEYKDLCRDKDDFTTNLIFDINDLIVLKKTCKMYELLIKMKVWATNILNSISSLRKPSKCEIQQPNNYKKVFIWVCLNKPKIINNLMLRQTRRYLFECVWINPKL